MAAKITFFIYKHIFCANFSLKNCLRKYLLGIMIQSLISSIFQSLFYGNNFYFCQHFFQKEEDILDF